MRCEAENSRTLLLSCTHTHQCLYVFEFLSLFHSRSHKKHTGIQLPYQSHIPTLCFVWQLLEHGLLFFSLFLFLFIVKLFIYIYVLNRKILKVNRAWLSSFSAGSCSAKHRNTQTPLTFLSSTHENSTNKHCDSSLQNRPPHRVYIHVSFLSCKQLSNLFYLIDCQVATQCIRSCFYFILFLIVAHLDHK